jgi:integrase
MNVPIIKFIFDRKHSATKDKKGVIELRISYNRKQKYASTGISCYTGQWDAKQESINHQCLEYTELNALLLKIKQKALKVIGKMVDEDNIDIEAIPTLLKGNSTDITFDKYIRERMRKKQVSDYTKKAYHVFYSRFVEWGGMKFFSDVNERKVRDWDEYLHAFSWKVKDKYNKDVTKKYSQATIGSMHKNLKAFINDAMVDGYLRENPYIAKRIKIDKGSTRIDKFLTIEEINAIEKAEMPTHSLSEARDLFLIQVYTGLSFVDLMEYDFTPCKGAKDYAVFSGYRSKTGVLFTFVLTPKAKAILERYDYCMPKLPNQKYNVKLKLVADAAKVDKAPTSHDGRRSCGYMLLNAGVPIGIVSRILGHSSIKQTEQAYARYLDETIAEEIKKRIK